MVAAADMTRGRARTASSFFGTQFGPRDEETPSPEPIAAADAETVGETAAPAITTRAEPPVTPVEPVTPESPAIPEMPVTPESRNDAQTTVTSAVRVGERVRQRSRPAAVTAAVDEVRVVTVESWASVGPTEYAIGFTDPRHKISLVLSAPLLDLLESSRFAWAMRNQEWVMSHGRHLPGTSAWREALVRIGLKHIDDPDLFRTIRRDRRRRPTGETSVDLPAGLPAAGGGAPHDGWDAEDEGTAVKENAAIPSALSDELERVRVAWSFAHPEFIQHAGGMPWASGFFEGLARLGLKHLADPELGDLVHVDARRRN